MSTRGVRLLNQAMETTRTVQHSLLRFPSDISNRFTTKCHVGIGDFKVSERPRKLLARLNTQFSDSEHQQYYVSPIKQFKKKEKENNSEIKLVKKKLKFIKKMSKDLSLFSLETSGIENGNSLVDEEKISGAVEVLQAQVQQLRTEQKEVKRTMKEKKAQIKNTLRQKKGKQKSESSSSSSSSSSSESSGSENGEVIDMIRLRSNVLEQSKNSEAEQKIKVATSGTRASLVQQEKSEETLGIGDMSSQNYGSGGECSSSNGCNKEQTESIAEGTSAKKIEICMGGKCKKLGAEALLQEFGGKLGAEFAVSGCKCMGKCKDGPNLRVVDTPNGDQATRMLRPSINSLCIGVGLEDVDIILADILGKDKSNKYGMALS
ncbi:hypothetical protein Pint_00764 [Pistacia integerrima]|uniref:Uncharacterized protein n=1 Tax=Pistacia integerrima TaxID=434235 RepID=A0ACC0ZMD2_9ROSI|nr:hypothetical protein Pint_00764 [Pistacia integerrima]